MRFDERYLEELKARIRLSDVIGRTVKLRRQGREYVGLSPFGKERTPSFFVNDDKGFFHDFSSGKHGDLIGFLQETERLSFVEAVERLAAEAGMALPVEDPRAAAEAQKRKGLQDWLELAARWFQAELQRPSGADARAYLERRGLPASEWVRFGLGFAPAGRTALKDYLVAKGAKPGELVESGLLIAPEDGGAPYDRFRDRIIFPITDGRGRVVSFGGRAMDPEARAKYLNGPETSLFHKGSVLYGLPEARRLLHSGGENAPLIVVEGYMDVIACHRAEIAAVAPLGTALTEEQMAILWRLHPEPTLSFDGDAAGLRAAHRTIDRALPLLKPGCTFRFAAVKGGKDPDEVLREHGPMALKSQLAETKPFVEALFERERDAAEPLDTPERLVALRVKLRKMAATIADHDLSTAYREALLARYNVVRAADAARRRLERADKRLVRVNGRIVPPLSGATRIGIDAAKILETAVKPSTAAVIKKILDDPWVVEAEIERLERQGVGELRLQPLIQAIVRIWLTSPALDGSQFAAHLRSDGFGALLDQIERGAEKSKAPFLQGDLPAERSRAVWSHTFEALLDLAYLERAIGGIKSADTIEFPVLRELKAQRDKAQRALVSGAVWVDAMSLASESLASESLASGSLASGSLASGSLASGSLATGLALESLATGSTESVIPATGTTYQ